MRTRRYDGAELRRVLSAMVMDQKVLSRIARQWVPEGLFDAKWANLVGGLVVRHYEEYGRAPQDELTGLFESWANRTTADDKTIESVEGFLRRLSDGYEAEESDYVLDIAKHYFDKVRVEREIEAAKLEIEHDKIEDAVARLQNINKVNLGEDSYLEASSDPGAWALLSERENVRPLVVYQGALGEFFGDSFTRGSLYSFMAIDKTGKTTWLIDLAYRAIRQRNRVAFFDTGDGDQEEVLTRMACRVTGCQLYTETIGMPSSWEGDDPVIIDTKLEGVDYLEGYRRFRKLCKSDDAFRISCHSNSTASVADIDGILEGWERNGWVPDVIVIDYADILAPPKGYRDPLDQIDETWKQLRRMSQRRHALVFTATQSAATGYGKENFLLSKSDFSGRKTKLAVVNGMICINVSHREKDLGMARVNWIARRKGRYNEKAFVRVAGHMAIQNPAILSKR